MKQHVRLSDPIRLILEENVGPVTVDVAQRNGGFHGTLTLSRKIEAQGHSRRDEELRWRLLSRDAAALLFEPDIRWDTFREANIIHDY